MTLFIMLLIAFGILLFINSIAPAYNFIVVLVAFVAIIALGTSSSMDGVLAAIVLYTYKVV